KAPAPIVADNKNANPESFRDWPFAENSSLLAVALLLVLLLVFLVRIALFAGLAVFVGCDAALVGAFLAGRFGLFTAGLLLFRRLVIVCHHRASQQRQRARRHA